MTCKQFDNLLVDFMDGNLSRNQSKEVRAHAESCAACRAALTQYQNMVAKLNHFPAQTCPDSVIDSVLDAVPATESSLIRRLSSHIAQGRAWKVSFVAAVAILVISIVLFHPQNPPVVDQDHKYTEADIEQAKLGVELALRYFNHYAKEAENAIEEQVLAKGIVEPVNASIKIAFKPILDGGSK